MKTYKKRAKVGWSVGKGEKDSSNRSERNFIKKELFRETLISSDDERLSIKNEIIRDEYNREIFNEITRERPDLIRDSVLPVRKPKGKFPTRKSLESKISHIQRKLDALHSDSFHLGSRRNYYREILLKLNELLDSLKKDCK